MSHQNTIEVYAVVSHEVLNNGFFEMATLDSWPEYRHERQPCGSPSHRVFNIRQTRRRLINLSRLEGQDGKRVCDHSEDGVNAIPERIC